MNKSEIKYNNLNYKRLYKINAKVEYPILVLKAEIELLKSAATATNK